MAFRKTYIHAILFVLILTLGFGSTIGQASSFFDGISLSLEQDIGRSNYQEVLGQKQVVRLPQWEENRLNAIFNRLVATSGRRHEVNFSLTVVKDDSVNAFALPGGYVFLNTGMLNFAQNDGEIAGVLGHEIAHIDRKHSMQAVYRAVGISVVMSLLFNNGKDSDRRETMRKLTAVSMNLVQLGYSRNAEFEADRYGVMFMQQAGYNKYDMLNFWRRIEGKEGTKASAFTAFFSTHPPTSERIRRIEELR